MDLSTKLFRVYRTCWEMLKDRGYLVADEKVNLTLDDFQKEFGSGEGIRREDLTISVPKVDDPQNQILVFFPDEEKLGVDRIMQYMERMKEEAIHRAVLVLQRKLSAKAKTHIALSAHKFHIQDFLEEELLVNITRHVMVPKHQVLGPEDKATLLRRYKVRETQLPRIQLSDPVAKYLGMERGEVVRIVRASETAGRYVTYRYCI